MTLPKSASFTPETEFQKNQDSSAQVNKNKIDTYVVWLEMYSESTIWSDSNDW